MKKIIAKKKFGQNFLKDDDVLNKIIEAMPYSKNRVVEIGPGLGDLTEKLVKCKNVTAYEVDIDLYQILKLKFNNERLNQKLDLVLINILDVWRDKKTLYDGKYDLIANLPYYIATNIILKALEDTNCNHIIVMMQKEVAKKFAANEGEKEFSSLGVITKLLSQESKILFDVPSSAFEPAPKVTSSILYIKKDNVKSLDDEFKQFLKIAFSQPRKKLIKNLSTIFNKNLLLDIFREFNINDNIRPHEVSAFLYRYIYEKVIIYGRDKTGNDNPK